MEQLQWEIEGSVGDVPYGVQRVAAGARPPAARTACLLELLVEEVQRRNVGEVPRSENVDIEWMQERDRRVPEQGASCLLPPLTALTSLELTYVF